MNKLSSNGLVIRAARSLFVALFATHSIACVETLACPTGMHTEGGLCVPDAAIDAGLDALDLDASTLDDAPGSDGDDLDAGAEVDAAEFVDAGLDAGSLDAGSLDAGVLDAGPDAPACVPALDPIDDAFLDTNCDGIDGVAAAGIFVSPTGSPTAAGTRADPFSTLAAGLSAATSMSRSFVFVAVGTYVSDSVVLVPSITVVGGYDPSTWTRSLTLPIVRGAAGVTVLRATDAPSASVIGIAFEATAATTGSSIAASFVRSSGSRLEHVTIRAAAGAPGAPGARGATGAAGSVGSPGGDANNILNGATCPGGVSSPGRGGAGGVSACGCGDGGRGGNSASVGVMGATCGVAAGGGPGAVGSMTVNPTVGLDGAMGATGPAGARAPAMGTFTSAAVYTAPVGVAGMSGLSGSGGGGGGGAIACAPGGGCIRSGGGGGGGGSGGCGGGGGTAARGGGASVGLYLWATDITLVDVEIMGAAGGGGGAGGAGGAGGMGGTFGAGGMPNVCVTAVYGGARGGTGGVGGTGGASAGGTGGPSVGIVLGGASSEAGGSSGVVITRGTGGAAGPLASGGMTGLVGMALDRYMVP